MHYIVQLPHVFCTQDTHAAQRQQHTDMSKYFWNKLSVHAWNPAIMTSHYCKRNNSVQQTTAWQISENQAMV